MVSHYVQSFSKLLNISQTSLYQETLLRLMLITFQYPCGNVHTREAMRVQNVTINIVVRMH